MCKDYACLIIATCLAITHLILITPCEYCQTITPHQMLLQGISLFVQIRHRLWETSQCLSVNLASCSDALRALSFSKLELLLGSCSATPSPTHREYARASRSRTDLCDLVVAASVLLLSLLDFLERLKKDICGFVVDVICLWIECYDWWWLLLLLDCVLLCPDGGENIAATTRISQIHILAGKIATMATMRQFRRRREHCISEALRHFPNRDWIFCNVTKSLIPQA